jgi:hypothetical protein
MKAKSVLASIVVVLFAIGCGSGDDTNGTGTADSGEEIQLTFDGDSCDGGLDCSRTCVYEGATELAAGPTTLTFINATDELAYVEIVWHTGDETAQDVSDYLRLVPSGKHRPYWSEAVPGSYKTIPPGETFVRELEFEPAIHHIVCGMSDPNRVWLGSVFTVTG